MTFRLRPLPLLISALFANQALAGAPASTALPQGGQVVAGQASLNTSGARLDITQTTQRAILDWQSFNIGSAAQVNFNQPNSAAVALNRVLAGEASQIHGQLSANGQVFLVNPSGVIFASGSRVDVGGLVASTLNIANDDFMAGRLRFERNGATGGIRNQGNLSAADGGYIALLAPEVINEGVVSARLGSVAFAAGERATLSVGADGRLSVALDPATVNTLVENRHLVQADGGTVLMSAQAAGTLLSAVVANPGAIEARTLENRAGRIMLLADMQQGEVLLSGSIDASAALTPSPLAVTNDLAVVVGQPSQMASSSIREGRGEGVAGGFVETSAAHVKIADSARVTTLGANGGKNGIWLIDPFDYTIAAAGGDITGATLSTNLGGGNIIIQSTNGTAGTAGDVNVNDVVAWSANTLTLNAQNNINLNANLNGSGTAKLALEYGQGAVAAGNLSDYIVHAAVNLPAGQNFSTKLGSDGVVANYTVITSLGVAGDATTTTLQGMKNNLTGKYVLGSDIDASATVGWNAGAGFVAVGPSWGNTFSGLFHGLGHTISGLVINRPASDSQGLFGWTWIGGVVRDVGMVGGSVVGKWEVGGLVGRNIGTISNSYATGSVTGNESVGGLVGFNEGTVSNSYATGSVTGDFVGGLLGYNNFGTVSNSYATGSVTGNSVGGLIGVNNSGTVNNGYWDTQTSGQATSSGGTGKTTAEMKQLASFTGWDISASGGSNAVWRIYAGQSAPLLRSFLTPATITASAASKTYDGNAYGGGNGITCSTGACGAAGYLGAAAYSGTSQGAINANTYVITPSGLYSNQQGYDITYANGTLTVDPRAITVTANNQTRAYGSANPTTGSTTVTTGTLAGSDALGNATLTAAGSATATANAGTAHAITPGIQTLSTGSAANYTISYVGGTLTITLAPLTATANAASKTYDGLAYTGGNGVAYSGFVNGETAAVLGGALAWGGTGQGAVDIGSYTLIPSGLTSGNYTISFVDGVLAITAVPPTPTFSDNQPDGGQITRALTERPVAAPPSAASALMAAASPAAVNAVMIAIPGLMEIRTDFVRLPGE